MSAAMSVTSSSFITIFTPSGGDCESERSSFASFEHDAGPDVLGGAHVCAEKGVDFWPDTT